MDELFANRNASELAEKATAAEAAQSHLRSLQAEATRLQAEQRMREESVQAAHTMSNAVEDLTAQYADAVCPCLHPLCPWLLQFDHRNCSKQY